MKLIKNINITIYLIILISFMFPIIAEARWATYEDVDVEAEFQKMEIQINKDGRYTIIAEDQIKILKESARNTFGTFTHTYNSNIESMTILEAKTINKEKIYEVSPENIEDKPLSSGIKAFDQRNQVMISFPQVEVGSQIYVKYTIVIKEVPIPNQYNFSSYFNSIYGKNINYIIKSEIPLQLKINDPLKSLEVSNEKIKGNFNDKNSNNKDKDLDTEYQLISMKNKKNVAIFNKVINEGESFYVDPKNLTWFSISSYKSYNEIGDYFAPKYEDVIKKYLPQLYKEIKIIAEKEKTDIDRINSVTSQLFDKIRYMGNWQEINGGFIPRSLNKIVELGVADCKEFSSSIVAILRNMGYDANVAFILSQDEYIPRPFLINLEDFDHAIVKVNNVNGKDLWIDSTSGISMANYIPKNISDRPALVLYKDKSQYEFTSKFEIENSILNHKIIQTYDSQNNIIHNKRIVELKGPKAQPLTGALLNTSVEYLKDFIIQKISGVSDTFNNKIILPKLNSRIVKDIIFQVEYDQNINGSITNAGYALDDILFDDALKNIASQIINIKNDRVSNVILNIKLGINNYYNILQNFSSTCSNKDNIVGTKCDFNSNNLKNLEYNFDTPWFSAKRTLEYKENDIIINSMITVHKSIITVEDIKSVEFKKLQNALKLYNHSLIIFDNIKPIIELPVFKH